MLKILIFKANQPSHAAVDVHTIQTHSERSQWGRRNKKASALHRHGNTVNLGLLDCGNFLFHHGGPLDCGIILCFTVDRYNRPQKLYLFYRASLVRGTCFVLPWTAERRKRFCLIVLSHASKPSMIFWWCSCSLCDWLVSSPPVCCL